MQSTIVQIGKYSYSKDKALGQGTHSTVYLGQRNQDKKYVAVKTIRIRQLNTPTKKHLLDCQIAALTALQNPYICQAYQILKDSEFYFIPMEYCSKGTLRDYIQSKGKLQQNEAVQIFSKIVEGYSAIKKAGFVHRDLKSQNILLKQSMEPAINDFGYCEKANTQNQKLNYNVGSPAYMSPQAYNESIYSQKSDIWALGIVLHEMLTGTIPVMRTHDVDQYFRYLKNMKTAEIVNGTISNSCLKLLLSCLRVNTNQRCSTEQLIKLVNQCKRQYNSNNQQRALALPQKYQQFYQTQNCVSLMQKKNSSEINRSVELSYPIFNPNTNSSINNWNKPQNQVAIYQWPNKDKLSNISGQVTRDNSVTKSIDSSNYENFAKLPPRLPNNYNEPVFGNLRRKVQHSYSDNSNVNCPERVQMNMTPIRNNYVNMNGPNQYTNQRREPMTQNVLMAKNRNIGISYNSPAKINKSYSISNLGSSFQF